MRTGKYRLLPLPVIEDARIGKPDAIDRVFRHYDLYMNKLCLRRVFDEDGCSHYCVDEYMKGCIKTVLISAILKMRY
jgi:hypothetical protein